MDLNFNTICKYAFRMCKYQIIHPGSTGNRQKYKKIIKSTLCALRPAFAENNPFQIKLNPVNQKSACRRSPLSARGWWTHALWQERGMLSEHATRVKGQRSVVSRDQGAVSPMTGAAARSGSRGGCEGAGGRPCHATRVGKGGVPAWINEFHRRRALAPQKQPRDVGSAAKHTLFNKIIWWMK